MNPRLRTALFLSALASVPALAGQGGPFQADPPHTRRHVKVGSDSTDYSSDPAGRAARSQELTKLQVAAREAFTRGDLRQARRESETAMLLEPDDATSACILADVAFREGRLDEVAGVLAPFGQRDIDRYEVFPRAALAAALKGQPVPGAEAYCRDQLSVPVPAAMLEGSLPRKGTRRSEPIVAALALGVLSYTEHARGELYFGIVLRLDPENPLANFELSLIDSEKHRYESARARLELAMRRCGPAMRSVVQRRLHEVDIARSKTKAMA